MRTVNQAILVAVSTIVSLSIPNSLIHAQQWVGHHRVSQQPVWIEQSPIYESSPQFYPSVVPCQIVHVNNYYYLPRSPVIVESYPVVHSTPVQVNVVPQNEPAQLVHSGNIEYSHVHEWKKGHSPPELEQPIKVEHVHVVKLEKDGLGLTTKFQQQVEAAITVSYTHLTLPTIYSV